MYCNNCRTPLESGDMFCPNCGTPVPQAPPQQTYNEPAYYQPAMPQKKSNALQIVAIVLASIAALVATGVIIWMIASDNEGGNSAEVENNVIYPPSFEYITGSSTRGPDVDTSLGETCYYYEYYATDGRMDTAWTPNRNTDTSPSIKLHSSKKQTVSGIRMTNGYCKSEKTYTKNRRIRKVRITYEGGETIAEFGSNHYREMLDVPFGKTVETDFINIEILDSYYGAWLDIAISEIEAY